MSIVYWGIEDSLADAKDIPHVYVGRRKNGRKWKWFVDVDSIYIDNRDKQNLSESSITRIFEKARDIDCQAQTPDSASNYSNRDEIWDLQKSHSEGVFRLLFRKKDDAILLADFISKVIENQFNVELEVDA